MKIGLALAGGGSLGAYQVGILKYLKEKNWHFDVVTGTSVGAINGALVVTDDIEELEKLWLEISNDKIMLNGMDLNKELLTELNPDHIFKFLKNASNLVVESIFNRLSVDINVSKQAIISDFNRYNTISTIKKNDEKQSEVIKLIQNQNKVIAAELLILKIASISSANYNKVVDSMIEYRFLNEDSRTLMNAFGIYYRKYNSFNELSFLDTTSEDAKKIYFRYQENIHFKYSLGDVLELPKLIKIFDEYEAKQKMLQLLKEACESSNKDEISAKLEESRNLRKKMKL